MSLTQLQVRRVRNLREVEIAPGPGLNVIAGPNASGKTSLLESIHLLGLARSFRTPYIRRVIMRGESTLQVVGRVERGGRRFALGIEKGPRHTDMRLGGNRVQQVSELARALPLQLITPETHELLDQGPRFRRQFLDWGVFHVEHGFVDWWRSYHRALRQRNLSLRRNAPDRLVRAWDDALVEAGERIDQARRTYVLALAPVLQDYCMRLFGTPVEASYLAGWGQGVTLRDALEQGLAGDRQAGYTRHGPHRGELSLRADGMPAQQVLSRGQQKLLVSAMRLAQMRELQRQAGESGLLLVDDLAAELDRAHRQRLLGLLLETGAQLFVTVTEAELLEIPADVRPRTFHVEHGQVREMV